jgi:hypothetical protein
MKKFKFTSSRSLTVNIRAIRGVTVIKKVHAKVFKCQCVELHVIKSLIYYIYYKVSLIFVLHLGSPERAIDLIWVTEHKG